MIHPKLANNQLIFYKLTAPLHVKRSHYHSYVELNILEYQEKRNGHLHELHNWKQKEGGLRVQLVLKESLHPN